MKKAYHQRQTPKTKTKTKNKHKLCSLEIFSSLPLGLDHGQFSLRWELVDMSDENSLTVYHNKPYILHHISFHFISLFQDFGGFSFDLKAI